MFPNGTFAMAQHLGSKQDKLGRKSCFSCWDKEILIVILYLLCDIGKQNVLQQPPLFRRAPEPLRRTGRDNLKRVCWNLTAYRRQALFSVMTVSTVSFFLEWLKWEEIIMYFCV